MHWRVVPLPRVVRYRKTKDILCCGAAEIPCATPVCWNCSPQTGNCPWFPVPGLAQPTPDSGFCSSSHQQSWPSAAAAPEGTKINSKVHQGPAGSSCPGFSGKEEELSLTWSSGCSPWAPSRFFPHSPCSAPCSVRAGDAFWTKLKNFKCIQNFSVHFPSGLCCAAMCIAVTFWLHKLLTLCGSTFVSTSCSLSSVLTWKQKKLKKLHPDLSQHQDCKRPEFSWNTYVKLLNAFSVVSECLGKSHCSDCFIFRIFAHWYLSTEFSCCVQLLWSCLYALKAPAFVGQCKIFAGLLLMQPLSSRTERCSAKQWCSGRINRCLLGVVPGVSAFLPCVWKQIDLFSLKDRLQRCKP